MAKTAGNGVVSEKINTALVDDEGMEDIGTGGYLQRYRVDCWGLTPLVMNSNAALLEDKPDTGRDPAEYDREHFMEKCHVTDAGQLFVPRHAIHKMSVVACKFVTRKPAGTLMKSFAAFIEAALFVEDDAPVEVPISAVKPWTAIVNLNPSRGPRGPRGPRTRPLIPLPWRASTAITVVDGTLSVEVLREILDRAGRLCGLLDARTLGFGRCKITLEELPND